MRWKYPTGKVYWYLATLKGSCFCPYVATPCFEYLVLMTFEVPISWAQHLTPPQTNNQCTSGFTSFQFRALGAFEKREQAQTTATMPP